MLPNLLHFAVAENVWNQTLMITSFWQ